MRPLRRPKPLRSRRVSPSGSPLGGTAAASLLVTTVAATDVVEQGVMAAATSQQTPVTAVGFGYLATEPAVVFGQQVAPRVVLRPARDERTRVDAKGKNLWSVSELGSFDVPSAA